MSVVHLESTRPFAAAGDPPGEQTLAHVLETMAEGVWETDADGRIVYANAAAAALFAVPRPELLGRHFREIVPPENLPAAEEIGRVARSGRSGRWEFTHRRPDGATLELVLSLSPVRDARGAPCGAVSVFTDVTDLRRTQEQLLHSQKMEAVGTLASGVAHDFNNLLVAVLGACDVALAQAGVTDGVRGELAHVQEAAWRAADLVRQLLTFGRRTPAQPVVTDLGRIVRRIEKLLRRTLGERIRVETRLAPEPWAVRVDPSQLDQVVMNLAVNARDAMPAGGILSIETRNVEVLHGGGDEPGLAPGRWAALVVTDQGHGMTPDVKSRIFEPFFTTKAIGHGTGLGLATVLGIVQQAGGEVRVDSRPGEGTTFRLYFPTWDGASREEVAAPPRAALDGAGRTVLVVEDEDLVREVTVRLLRQLGYRPRAAKGGEEALGVPLDDVAAVVSDVVMPGLSGPELGARLRERRPGLPLVFMSGYTGEHAAPLPDGALLLSKPFTRASLGAALATVLAERGAASLDAERGG